MNVELILQFLLIIKLSETPLGSQEKKGRIFFSLIFIGKFVSTNEANKRQILSDEEISNLRNFSL